MIDQLEEEVELMDRHIDILLRVIEDEPIGIMKLSNQGGYDHHKVRYSLRVLEEDELIEPSGQGAVTTERTEEFVSHLDERLTTLAERLDAMKLNDHVESNL
jgi:predicted transcriptional regulator